MVKKQKSRALLLQEGYKKWQEIVKSIAKNTDVQEALHRDAILTREYIRGNQWIYLDKFRNIREIPIDVVYDITGKRKRKPKPRETVNLLFPIWRTYKSYLIKARPRIVARPEDPNEVHDLMASRVATKVMEYLYETLIMRGKADQIFNYMLIYGTAFLHPIYNSKRQRVELKVIPPTQIYTFPVNATSWEQVLGIVWKRSVPTDALKKAFPEYADDFNPDSDAMEDIDIYRMAGIQYENKRTTVYDYWELPTKESNGVYLSMTRDKGLDYIPHFPFENDNFEGERQLPFIPIYDNKLDDSVYGFSTLGMLKDRQLSYNRAKSDIALLRRMVPKLLIDVESRLKMRDVIDDDVTVIEFSSAHDAKPPNFTAVPNLNSWLFQEVVGMPGEIEHISGFHHTVLRSESIGSLQSGVGIRQLIEKDELRLTPALESIRFGFSKTFEQLYSLVKQYYDESQIRDILGERGEIDILTFNDIPMSPMTFIIEETSFTPYSQTYRQEIMLKLLTMGLFNLADATVRKNVYEYIDPNLAMTFEPTAKEERYAKWENSEMLKGTDVPVKPDDMDSVHINIHNEIAKDVRFRDLPETVKKRFLTHIEFHRMQGQQKAQQAMQMMMMSQAGGGKPGEGEMPPQQQG